MKTYTENSINKRIKLIAEKLCNGNISELARIIGVNQPALRDVVGAKQVKPGFDILNKIVDNATLNIDAKWLLTGKGNMQLEEIYTAAEPEPVYNLSKKQENKLINELQRLNDMSLKQMEWFKKELDKKQEIIDLIFSGQVVINKND